MSNIYVFFLYLTLPGDKYHCKWKSFLITTNIIAYIYLEKELSAALL